MIARKFVKLAKTLPVDLGQYEFRYATKGKLIAYDLVPEGDGRTALDVGCRDGFWSHQLRSKGYTVTSVDLCPQCPDATAVDVNGPLPFANSMFDVIWCSEVIEHLSNPKGAIAEFRRVLKAGGVLLLTTPNKDFWLFKFLTCMGMPLTAIQNEDHDQEFSYSELQQLVGGEQYGYFPYVVLKKKLRGARPALSPTIVQHWVKQ